ncbi:predicted protein [Nematostella vectensis]|uniref:Kinetochore protein NDC80 n=1 Tax=Nematostella vectensis TaxID=45351 RepID=A7SC79_NEMVE|nr:predicted protein [Nematostella vectensis]|eukprot:XP_001630758.1 predicted protein [Nematostella vectensis]
MKEFKRIFLFIYKYVNDSSKVQTAIEKKPEEEIPKILKMLGYPFNISKSSMFSVGSPHTWPNLLGALCYLIELIRSMLQDCIQQKKGLAADEEKFRKYIGDLKRHSTKMEESDAQTEEEIQAIIFMAHYGLAREIENVR